MTATVLWIDSRNQYFEGQVLGCDGVKYYFNHSTAIGMPSRGQIVKIRVDSESIYPCAYVVSLLNLKFTEENK